MTALFFKFYIFHRLFNITPIKAIPLWIGSATNSK